MTDQRMGERASISLGQQELATQPSGWSRARVRGVPLGALQLVELSILSVVTLAAFLLRVSWLSTPSLWIEEAGFALLSSNPLPELIRRLASDDLQSPLYPIFLHLWMALAGSGEFALRLPSVIFGAALVPLIYWTARELGSQSGQERPLDVGLEGTIGLLAATLASFSCLYIGLSQSVGPFALLTLLTLLSSFLLLRALPGRGWKLWTAYVMVTAAALYTHYTAFPLLACHLLYALVAGRPRPRAVKRYFIVLLALAAICLPLGIYSVSRFGLVASWLSPQSLETALRTSLIQALAGGAEESRRVLAPLGLAVTALGLFALVQSAFHRKASHPALFLLLYLEVPIGLLLFFSDPIIGFDPRRLLVATPAFYLVLAWGVAPLLGGMGRRDFPLSLRMIPLSAGILALASLLALQPLYGDPQRVSYATQGGQVPVYGDYRALVSYLENRSEAGDGVVLMADTSSPYRYYGRLALPEYTVPSQEDSGEALRQVGMLAERHSRLWFLLWRPELADPAGLVLHRLRQQGQEIDPGLSSGGLDLHLFQPGSGRSLVSNPPVDHRLEAVFEGKVELQGWSSSRTEAAGGDTVEYDLHWRSLRRIESELQGTLSLVDGEGHRWAVESRTMPVETYPARRWREQEILHDSYYLTLPPGIPPGKYLTQVRLSDPRANRFLSIDSASGSPAGDTLSLGWLTVGLTPAGVLAEATKERAASLEDRRGSPTFLSTIAPALMPSLLGMAGPTEGTPGAKWKTTAGEVELKEARLGRRYYLPAERAEVTLDLAVMEPPSADLTVRIALLDWTGQTVTEVDLLLSHGYATSRWRPGDRILTKQWLPLPEGPIDGKFWVLAALALPGETIIPASRYVQVGTIEIPPLDEPDRFPVARLTP